MADLLINGYDTSELGLYVEELQGWSDGAQRKDLLVTVPGRVGQVPSSTFTTVEPRLLGVLGVVKGATQAELQTRLTELKYRAEAGRVELSFADDTTRFLRARCQQFQVAPNQGPAFAIAERRVGLQFLCLDPHRHTVEGTVVALPTGVAVPVPVGTGTVCPVLRIWNCGTACTVTYSNAMGTVVSTLTLAFSPGLGANDFAEIDCSTFQCTKSVAGVVTSVYPVTAGDFLRLDPNDGAPLDSVYATVTISAGVGELLYRMAWS